MQLDPQFRAALSEWEIIRSRAQQEKLTRAEAKLHSLQLRARSGLSAIDSWLSIADSRRKLEELKAGAVTAGLDDLETRWRPVCLPGVDGDVAQWLLLQERAHATKLFSTATRWAAIVPEGTAELRQRHAVFCEDLSNASAKALRSWREAHAAAEQAWSAHSDLQERASHAVAEKRAPPDSWMSEVRYKERAQECLVQVRHAEDLLSSNGALITQLENERSQCWESFARSYANLISESTHASECAQHDSPSDEVLQKAPNTIVSTPMIPSVRPLADGEVDAALAPEIPEMPTTSNGVLINSLVSIEIPKGFLGIGGGGWCEGATLILTIHGYLHLFYVEGSAQQSASECRNTALGSGGCNLGESAIKASVYVPLATKCLFLRRGKDMTLEVAEMESATPGAQQGGAGDRLRKWISNGSGGSQLVPRRIHARMSVAAEFDELERRCQAFVREGQSFRAAGSQTLPDRPEKYVVEKGLLNVDAPGLEYRFSKQLQDRAGSDFYERWGSTVIGVDCGDGWLRVGDRFLPFQIKGVPVIRKV